MGCSSDSSAPACIPITCLNGGISTADCGCNCPINYTGINCSEEKTPTQIIISKAVITKFPALRTNGSYWDTNIITTNNKFPDIYIRLNDTAVLIDTRANYIDNASSSFNYTWTFTTPIVVTNVKDFKSLRMYDYSSTGDEQMGFTLFVPYNNGQSFPNVITVSDSSNSFEVQLYVTYQW